MTQPNTLTTSTVAAVCEFLVRCGVTDNHNDGLRRQTIAEHVDCYPDTAGDHLRAAVNRGWLASHPAVTLTSGQSHAKAYYPAAEEKRLVTDGGTDQYTGGTDRFLHVDLGTGLGGWTAPFQEADGWLSVGIDIRDDLNADVVADIRRLPVDCSPTLLTMSPPCTDFARWMLPWLDEPNPSMDLVESCLQAVDDLEPDYWVLENSRGLKQYWGREEDKRVGPYYLWGEFPPFDVGLTDGGKMSVSGENPEKRAEIPHELADSLRRSVEWSQCNVQPDTDHTEADQ